MSTPTQEAALPVIAQLVAAWDRYWTGGRSDQDAKAFAGAMNAVRGMLADPLQWTPVAQFHQAFRHPVATVPQVPPIEQRMLRVNMLAEELTEFAHACNVSLQITSDEDGQYEILALQEHDEDRCDLVEVADGLGDLRYLVDGGMVLFGLPGPAILAEIHRSNMSKLGADGQPIRREDGKTLKGPNYTPPDLRSILADAQAPRTEWHRDDDISGEALRLVGINASRAVMATWTDEQAYLADSWAMATHLHAWGNPDVVVRPRPAFLPEPWRGPGDDPTPVKAQEVESC